VEAPTSVYDFDVGSEQQEPTIATSTNDAGADEEQQDTPPITYKQADRKKKATKKQQQKKKQKKPKRKKKKKDKENESSSTSSSKRRTRSTRKSALVANKMQNMQAVTLSTKTVPSTSAVTPKKDKLSMSEVTPKQDKVDAVFSQSARPEDAKADEADTDLLNPLDVSQEFDEVQCAVCCKGVLAIDDPVVFCDGKGCSECLFAYLFSDCKWKLLST
jgi:hypothetical protein